MKIIVKCNWCQKEYLQYEKDIIISMHHFCSRKCKALWQKENLKGNNNPFFNKKHNKNTILQISTNKIGKKLSKIVKMKIGFKTNEHIKKAYESNCQCCVCQAKRGELVRGKNPNYDNHKLRGKNNPRYIDGRTILWSLIRNSSEYKQWRKSIYERDNYTCIDCGIEGNGKNLEAHHIKEFNKILEEFLGIYNQFSPIEDKETLLRLSFTHSPFWEISNGETLCKDCHYLKKSVTFE